MIDARIPLMAQNVDGMQMLENGSKVADLWLANKAEGELSRLYNETNGDLNKMMELGQQSKMARWVMPQLQAQQAAQQKAALDAQKVQADIGKTRSETMGNVDKVAQSQLESARRAVYAGAQSGNPQYIKMGLNEAKAAGAIDQPTFDQFNSQIDSFGNNPAKISEWAKAAVLAGSKNPDSFLFQTANNMADNETSRVNNQATVQATMRGQDMSAQTAANNLEQQAKQFNQNFEYQKQQDEIKSKQAEIKEFGGKAYIVYKNGDYKPALDVNGQQIKSQPNGTGGMSATLQKELFETDDAINSGQAVISGLQDAIKLNDKSYSGIGAVERAKGAGIFSNSVTAENTVLIDNIVTGNALNALKSTFGAAPTEGERKILLEMQGSANLPSNQRKALWERAEKAAQRRLDYNLQKAEALRNGSYTNSTYKPYVDLPNQPKSSNTSNNAVSEASSKWGI